MQMVLLLVIIADLIQIHLQLMNLMVKYFHVYYQINDLFEKGGEHHENY